MSETPAIGIDLGTTNTVVAMCVSLEKVEVIANSQGHRTTPSYVGFNNVEILTGHSAKYQARSNSANTIFDAKRLMGRKYNDKSVQNDIKNWPFVVVNEGEYPKFKVTYKSEEKTYSPEEISAIVLKEVKSYAEAYIGKPISDVVITVPAYFNNSQRQATTDAAKIAGLNIQRIINEPTAAAIAYGADKTINCANFLIFDLGGGTFDVSIITVDKDAFEVRATAGNDHIGGEDFNNKMVAHFMNKFNSEHNCDMSKNKRSVERLRSVCENAKIQLSNSTIANIELDALFEGHDLYTTISRDEFEEICAEYFDETLELVRNVLADAKIEKTKIDDIILIGGSTRIPKVQKMLQDYFGKELNKSINPDEAVAYGAAIQSGILKRLVTNVVLIDVIPLSLGVEVDEGAMSILIKRNIKKPYTKTKTYTTKYENQKSVQIKVYEGERALVQDNNFLGEFVLENIPPAPKNTPNILVTFSVNNNGMLEVSAVEESTKMKKKIIVSKEKHLSDEEINDMIKKAEENKIQDEQIKKKFYHINLFKKKCSKRITDEEDESKKESYKECLDWLDQNISEDLTKIRSKYKEFVPEGEEEECIQL